MVFFGGADGGFGIGSPYLTGQTDSQFGRALAALPYSGGGDVYNAKVAYAGPASGTVRTGYYGYYTAASIPSGTCSLTARLRGCPKVTATVTVGSDTYTLDLSTGVATKN